MVPCTVVEIQNYLMRGGMNWPAKYLKVICSNSLPFSSLDNIPAGHPASIFLKTHFSANPVSRSCPHNNISPSDA